MSSPGLAFVMHALRLHDTDRASFFHRIRPRRNVCALKRARHFVQERRIECAVSRAKKKPSSVSEAQSVSFILETHNLLRKKEISAVELTQDYLKRIELLEPSLHSFLHISADRALHSARQIDERIASGDEIGPLAGIPLAIKDNLCTNGVVTTAGSQMLSGYVPPYESTATQRLQAAGMVSLGKTNCDEFGMGSSTENSAYVVTSNPWDTARVPGGSSGGSAAAVAAQECVVALGSDTGGSIRQPASFCGVVGLKPSYGRVSRFGLVAYASSLDTVGPITRTVMDAALVLKEIAGHDPNDSTCSRLPVPDYAQALKGTDLKGKRVGLVKETMGDGLDSQVGAAVTAAAKHLSSFGASVVEVSCPRFQYGIESYYVIAPSEASANLARYDGVRYGNRIKDAPNLASMFCDSREAGLGEEVKRRIMIGTYALSSGYYDAYYLKAQKVRMLVKQDFDLAFEDVDVLLCPTAPTPAFKIGDKLSDPVSMYLEDLMTVPISLAGLPAISIPCGFTEDGLPIGMQLVGKLFREEDILQIAYAYEQSTEWHTRRPSIL